MNYLVGSEYYTEMLERRDHTPDCFVRPGEYLHHMYDEGVKYVVADALLECLEKAEQLADEVALMHLRLHKEQFDHLQSFTSSGNGSSAPQPLIGKVDLTQEDAQPELDNSFTPPEPESIEDLGLPMAFIIESVLRILQNQGRLSGAQLAEALCLPFAVIGEIIPEMRRQSLIDMVGQQADTIGDSGCQYQIKPPKGTEAVADALKKTEYVGPMPIPFDQYLKLVKAQTIQSVVVTRRNIERAFSDLVITPEVFAEIGPAINSGASIFLFGPPGNGKTSIAERITRLMGDDIYIPYAVLANGQIIKVYDPIIHEPVIAARSALQSILRESQHDTRFIKIKRPTVIVGGEMTLAMVDLSYNDSSRVYEAPLQMKANGGMLMIDDFGRQQVRPMDLLNRWIVPLEKRYDYLTTVTGTKLEVPFDELLVFSTNLDPNELADEAFLRRIKFKIEVRDPDQRQWRKIWKMFCEHRGVEYDEAAITYLIEKHFRPKDRPLRMCHPRDILDQMISISKYNMEPATFCPDLLDAACATYFVDNVERSFGAQVKLS